MATLADLVVNLNADTRKFDKGIDKAKGGLKSFEAVAKGVGVAVKASFVAVTGGIVAVGGAVLGLTGRFSTLASVADRAAQTGLSGAFLQRLEYAADQSGVAVETLQMGLKKLLMEMGKAGETTSLSDKLKQIHEEIQAADTAAQKAGISVKYFGKAGVEMTGLFANNMSDLNKLLAEAQQLGIGVDDEALARAGRADDAIQRMKFSFGALLDNLAIGIAPSIEAIADGITEWVAPLNQFLAKLNQMKEPLTFLGDLMVAAFDVAFESIESKYDAMVERFKNELIDVGLILVDPVGAANDLGARAGAAMAGGNEQPAAPKQTAEQRLDELLKKFGQLPGMQPAQEQLPQGPKADLIAALSPIGNMIESQIQSGEIAAKGLIERANMQATSWQKTFENWFASGPKSNQKTISLDIPKDEQKAKTDDRLASVAAKGSAEAMRTINFSNLRGKDPVLNATQQQTVAIKQGNNQIVQAIKDNALGMLGGWG